jgi:hypothetical protein
MRQYLYVGQQGDAVVVRDFNDTALEGLQKLVGGMIECVNPTKLGPSVDVWVNEEGLLYSDFGINLVASYITGRQLVGPAVFAGHNGKGETTDFPTAILARLMREGLMVDQRGMEPFEVANRFFPTSAYSEAVD